MNQFVFSLSNGASSVLPEISFRTAHFPEKMIHCLFIRQQLSIKVAWVTFDQNPAQVKDYVFNFRHIFSSAPCYECLVLLIMLPDRMDQGFGHFLTGS